MEKLRKKEVCQECLLELEDETKILPSIIDNNDNNTNIYSII